MKISKYLAFGLLVVGLMPALGQPTATASALTKFNLDFPGGSPAQLVNAIEKAMGKPLNAIIPTEDADVPLPALKMNNVDAPQLFQTLQAASVKTVAYVTSSGNGFAYGLPSQSYSEMTTSYGFKNAGNTPTDDTIWYFYAQKPSLPPLIKNNDCRFYSLALYLERGYTVDDITTAIQTGWKMQGDTSPPEISFHKETKLLIAVGEPDKLEVIDNVLKALEPLKVKPAPEIDSTTGLPLPKAESKAGK
jgi:hypothetical protein